MPRQHNYVIIPQLKGHNYVHVFDNTWFIVCNCGEIC